MLFRWDPKHDVIPSLDCLVEFERPPVLTATEPFIHSEAILCKQVGQHVGRPDSGVGALAHDWIIDRMHIAQSHDKFSVGKLGVRPAQ